MTILATSISLVCALLVGTFLGFRLCARLLVRKLGRAFDRLLNDPRNRNTLSVGWVLDRIHQRILEGATIDELHDWIHDEQARNSEATGEVMQSELAADRGEAPP